MALHRLLRRAVFARGFSLATFIVGSGLAIAACFTHRLGGLDFYCDDDNPCSDPIFNTCNAHLCVSLVDGGASLRCSTAMACTDARAPICDNGFCRSCTGAVDNMRCSGATGGQRPFCDISGNNQRCVACLKSSDCGDPKAAVCEKGQCRPCGANEECASGVCAVGTCADENKVAFVDSASPLCPSGAMSTGSRAAPFCEIAAAVNNLKGRKIVSVEGSDLPYNQQVIVSGLDVTIVGPGRLAKPAARMFLSGAASCIEVNPGGGSVVIDGLILERCGKSGVVCYGPGSVSLSRSNVTSEEVGVISNDCDVTLDGNWIVGNGIGGMQFKSGHYHVTNNFVVDHISKQAAVVLGDAASGTFAFNTIANDNASPNVGGIDCGMGSAKLIEDSIVVDNSVDIATRSQMVGKCVLSMVVTGDDTFASAIMQAPAFEQSRPYHLVRPSTCCIDVVRPGDGGAALLPDHDGDSKHRPIGQGWDVGAHEVQAP